MAAWISPIFRFTSSSGNAGVSTTSWRRSSPRPRSRFRTESDSLSPSRPAPASRCPPTNSMAASSSGPELDAAIEFVGGHLEAGAGRDGLSESLSVLKRDLGLGLDLLQEVVLTPAFPDDEVKRKIGEIQAAIQRSEESPETVASRALARLTFPNHPYGVPVEGTKESVGKLTRDDVVQFYRTFVRPDTTVIAVV